jgi:hypothetical protein
MHLKRQTKSAATAEDKGETARGAGKIYALREKSALTPKVGFGSGSV